MNSWSKGRVCAHDWLDRQCRWYGDTYMRNSNYDTTQYDYRLVYICKIDEYNVEPEKETEKEPEKEPEKRHELELEELT